MSPYSIAFAIGSLSGTEFAILVALFLILFGHKRLITAARHLNPWNIKTNYNVGKKDGLTSVNQDNSTKSGPKAGRS